MLPHGVAAGCSRPVSAFAPEPAPFDNELDFCDTLEHMRQLVPGPSSHYHRVQVDDAATFQTAVRLGAVHCSVPGTATDAELQACEAEQRLRELRAVEEPAWMWATDRATAFAMFMQQNVTLPVAQVSHTVHAAVASLLVDAARRK